MEKEGEGDNNGKDDMAIPPRAPGITNASLNRALRSQKEFDQLYMVRFISYTPLTCSKRVVALPHMRSPTGSRLIATTRCRM